MELWKIRIWVDTFIHLVYESEKKSNGHYKVKYK